jgi:hypothetical protein
MRFYYRIVNSSIPNSIDRKLKIPIVTIDFKDFSYNCMIDSGASVSHMHAEMGRSLGLDIEKGDKIMAKGVAGISFPSYIHKIKFNIKHYTCNIDVAFSSDFKLDVGLLGRKDFFEIFNIYFYQSKNIFELIPVNEYA